MKLGERLKELRAERDLLQREVAAKAGISFTYLSTLECGIQSPTLKTMGALAHAYGITLKDLLTGVEFGPAAAPKLPAALRKLAAAEVLSPDWIECLARIEHNGRRPRTQAAYMDLYLHLNRVLK